MNTHRTLYARNAFAAASLALLGGLAGTPAHAQEASPIQLRPDLSEQAQQQQEVRLVTRAEVRAQAEAAMASGEIDLRNGETPALRPVL